MGPWTGLNPLNHEHYLCGMELRIHGLLSTAAKPFDFEYIPLFCEDGIACTRALNLVVA